MFVDSSSNTGLVTVRGGGGNDVLASYGTAATETVGLVSAGTNSVSGYVEVGGAAVVMGRGEINVRGRPLSAP